MLGVTDSINSAPAVLVSGVDQGSAVTQPDGSLIVTSPGGDVVATHSDPLPATGIAVGVLPAVVEVAVIVPATSDLALTESQAQLEPAATPVAADSSAPTSTSEVVPAARAVWSDGIASAGNWTVQMVETGRAVIDLDPEYRLSINDVLAEVILQNRTTNVTTRIWGNAEVEVAGRSVGQFWGTSSFQLANGTLITANTIVSPNNSSAYMLERLIVTRDACGLVVTGISNATVGDVAIALAANATVFDRVPLPVGEPAVETPVQGAVIDLAAPASNVSPSEMAAAPAVSVDIEAPVLTTSPSAEANVVQPSIVAESLVPVEPPVAAPIATVAETVAAPVQSIVQPSATEAPVPLMQKTTDMPAIAPVVVSVEAPAPALASAPASEVVAAQAAEPAPATVMAPSIAPEAVSTLPAPISAAAMLVENTTPLRDAARARIDGYDMDDDHRDGLVFEETASGWVEEWDGQAISADVLAQTQPGQTFGPNSDIMSRTEFGAVISRFISIMASQGLANLSASRNSIFESQLRDLASQSDSQHAAKQAEERAARERRAVVTMLSAGVANATALRGYHA